MIVICGSQQWELTIKDRDDERDDPDFFSGAPKNADEAPIVAFALHTASVASGCSGGVPVASAAAAEALPALLHALDHLAAVVAAHQAGEAELHYRHQACQLEQPGQQWNAVQHPQHS